MTDYMYAVMDDHGIVTNIVASDNPGSVDVLRLLIPDAAHIMLATDTTGPAYIGGDMLDGRFRIPSPYASWVWDNASASWVAPVAYPEGGNGYTWDEESVSWVEIPPAPEPSPEPASGE